MDQRSYANKLGYMLETPVYPLVLAPGYKGSSNNPCGADNQQERLIDCFDRQNPQRLHAKHDSDIYRMSPV